MSNKNPTQCMRVLDYLDEHGSITQMEAMNVLGVMRLASRVSELRKQGHKITSTMQPVKNRFGETCRIKRYTIEEE